MSGKGKTFFPCFRERRISLAWGSAVQGPVGLHVRLWFKWQDQGGDNCLGYRPERMENPTPLFPRLPQLSGQAFRPGGKGTARAPVPSEEQLRTPRT